MVIKKTPKGNNQNAHLRECEWKKVARKTGADVTENNGGDVTKFTCRNFKGGKGKVFPKREISRVHMSKEIML